MIDSIDDICDGDDAWDEERVMSAAVTYIQHIMLHADSVMCGANCHSLPCTHTENELVLNSDGHSS